MAKIVEVQYDGMIGLVVNATNEVFETADSVAELLEKLNDAKVVNFIKWEGNRFGLETTVLIGKALSRHPEFRQALWQNMFVGSVEAVIPLGIKNLADGLILANAQLTVLNLSDNKFGANGVSIIENLIRSKVCFTLQELYVNNCDLGSGGGALLVLALLDCYKYSSATGAPLSLKKFCAGRNEFGDWAIKWFAKIFKQLITLREVALPQNAISPNAITKLAESFKLNPNLESINLQGNSVDVSASVQLFQSLACLPRLRRINLSDCGLNSCGAFVAAQALKSGLKHLEILDVGYNEIQFDGAQHFINAVSERPELKQIILSGNPLNQTQKKALIDSCQKSLFIVDGPLVVDDDSVPTSVANITPGPSNSTLTDVRSYIDDSDELDEDSKVNSENLVDPMEREAEKRKNLGLQWENIMPLVQPVFDREINKPKTTKDDYNDDYMNSDDYMNKFLENFKAEMDTITKMANEELDQVSLEQSNMSILYQTAMSHCSALELSAADESSTLVDEEIEDKSLEDVKTEMKQTMYPVEKEKDSANKSDSSLIKPISMAQNINQQDETEPDTNKAFTLQGNEGPGNIATASVHTDVKGVCEEPSTSSLALSTSKTVPIKKMTAEKFCFSVEPLSLEEFDNLEGNDKFKELMEFIDTFTGDSYLLMFIFTALKCAQLSLVSKEALEVAMNLFQACFDYAIAQDDGKRVAQHLLKQLGLLEHKEPFKARYDPESCRYALKQTLLHRPFACKIMKNTFEFYLKNGEDVKKST